MAPGPSGVRGMHLDPGVREPRRRDVPVHERREVVVRVAVEVPDEHHREVRGQGPRQEFRHLGPLDLLDAVLQVRRDEAELPPARLRLHRRPRAGHGDAVSDGELHRGLEVARAAHRGLHAPPRQDHVPVRESDVLQAVLPEPRQLDVDALCHGCHAVAEPPLTERAAEDLEEVVLHRPGAPGPVRGGVGRELGTPDRDLLQAHERGLLLRDLVGQGTGADLEVRGLHLGPCPGHGRGDGPGVVDQSPHGPAQIGPEVDVARHDGDGLRLPGERLAGRRSAGLRYAERHDHGEPSDGNPGSGHGVLLPACPAGSPARTAGPAARSPCGGLAGWSPGACTARAERVLREGICRVSTPVDTWSART